MLQTHTHSIVDRQLTHTQVENQAFSPFLFLQVLYSPLLVAKFQSVCECVCVFVCVCVCLASRHKNQQGALLYHCSSSAGSKRAVLLFSLSAPPLALFLCLFMSLTQACCLWELSVSVSVERWTVITSNAQAGIKTGAWGEQCCCCRCCSALLVVSFPPSLSLSGTAWRRERVGGVWRGLVDRG